MSIFLSFASLIRLKKWQYDGAWKFSLPVSLAASIAVFCTVDLLWLRQKCDMPHSVFPECLWFPLKYWWRLAVLVLYVIWNSRNNPVFERCNGIMQMFWGGCAFIMWHNRLLILDHKRLSDVWGVCIPKTFLLLGFEVQWP